MTAPDAPGFEPPIYPYERLAPALQKAAAHEGGVVDLSIGTPTDPPPPAALEALAGADDRGTVRGYPASIGSEVLRVAAATWEKERFGVDVAPDAHAVCVGTKEFVATLPQWLHLRTPRRDTVLYPAISYPTYEMGARLAGCRAVPVPVDDAFRLDLSAVSDEDAARALCLWVNTPGNPAGQLDDLGAAAEWGRAHRVPVFSDECYVEFTWTGPPRTILATGTEGVVAVHSLSKRSNMAGLRLGWYCGDADLVQYLAEVRKHVGMMAAGPVQAAGAAALGDQAHVEEQRARYLERLIFMRDLLVALGAEVERPDGGFYLWARPPDGDAWKFTERLAADAGALVSPGEFYGPAGRERVRVALVRPMEQLRLVAGRLGL